MAAEDQVKCINIGLVYPFLPRRRFNFSVQKIFPDGRKLLARWSCLRRLIDLIRKLINSMANQNWRTFRFTDIPFS